jgi:hypothetical protein
MWWRLARLSYPTSSRVAGSIARLRAAETGFGTTLDFAHRRAWMMLGTILILSLGAPAAGVVSGLCR